MRAQLRDWPFYWFAGLALLGFCGMAQAVSPPAFRQLGVGEGLPDHHVEAMVQDRQGFVWIATRSGLVRHEGERMVPLPVDRRDPRALPGSNILTLYAASTGSVWAAIEGQGIVEIDSELKVVRRLRPQRQGGRLLDMNVWSIAEGCDGRIWLAFMQGGLASFDPQGDRLELIPQSSARGLKRVRLSDASRG
jgi:ligand-binding sensor domain-containing protein